MGGGPDREHMLIVLRSPEPNGLITKMKERFPYIDVTYFQMKSTRANSVSAEEKGDLKGSYLLTLLIVFAHFLQQAFSFDTVFVQISTTI
jgi:hypothetical protein